MYVCDEANIETHGLKPMGRLAHDAGWETAFVSRVTRMVQRDWNHPSIILWSMGNEAGRGRNLVKARQALLDLDTSRPVCYESGTSSYIIKFRRSKFSPLSHLTFSPRKGGPGQKELAERN